MEVVQAILDAIQSQMFQTAGLVVIIVGLASLEKRCKKLEKGIEALRRPVAGTPESELDDERVVVAEEPDASKGIPCPPPTALL